MASPATAPTPLDRAIGTIATGVPIRIASGSPQPAAPQPAAPQPAAPQPANPALPPPVKSMRDLGGTRPLVVAIDAGHGGQDTGALGGGGTREKDVTLAIARELARQVDATPGLKAHLTRDTDYFIPCRSARGARGARRHLHLDPRRFLHQPDARGAGVFVLSTRGASSQRARWLADKENAADVIGGDRVRGGDNVLTSVLLDLTQSGNMKASEDAAGYVLGNLDAIGNLHKGEVERANSRCCAPRTTCRRCWSKPASSPTRARKPGCAASPTSSSSRARSSTASIATSPPSRRRARCTRCARSGQDGGASGVGAGGSP